MSLARNSFVHKALAGFCCVVVLTLLTAAVSHSGSVAVPANQAQAAAAAALVSASR